MIIERATVLQTREPITSRHFAHEPALEKRGAQLPLHASALGKALLAFAPTDIVTNLLSSPLERLTKRTPTAAALRVQLAAPDREAREFAEAPRFGHPDLEHHLAGDQAAAG